MNLESIHFCLVKNYCIEVGKQKPLKLCVRVSQATPQRRTRRSWCNVFVRLCPRQGGTVSKSIQSCGIATSGCWRLLVIPKVDGEIVSIGKNMEKLHYDQTMIDNVDTRVCRSFYLFCCVKSDLTFREFWVAPCYISLDIQRNTYGLFSKEGLPSRELAYPTLGKGKSSSKVPNKRGYVSS